MRFHDIRQGWATIWTGGPLKEFCWALECLKVGFLTRWSGQAGSPDIGVRTPQAGHTWAGCPWPGGWDEAAGCSIQDWDGQAGPGLRLGSWADARVGPEPGGRSASDSFMSLWQALVPQGTSTHHGCVGSTWGLCPTSYPHAVTTLWSWPWLRPCLPVLPRLPNWACPA